MRSLGTLSAVLVLSIVAARGVSAAGIPQVLDSIEQAKIQCYLNRLQGADSPSSEACRRLTSSQVSYIDSMAQKFCGNPASSDPDENGPGQFCRLVRLQDSGDPAIHALVSQRDLQFVSPRCEAAPLKDVLSTVDWENGSNIVDDHEFAASMRRSWGCDSGKLVVYNEGGHPHVREDFTCVPAKMPFRCNSSKDPIPVGAQNSDESQRQLLAAQAIEFNNSDFVPTSYGACLIRSKEDFSYSPPFDAPELPAAKGTSARPESFDAYLSRLSSPEQVSAAKLAAASAEQTAQRMFSSSALLMGKGSERFRLSTRSILTPENIALVKQNYAAAKQGVLDYLASIHAPPEVIARIKRTQLFDLEAFTRSPHWKSDNYLMNDLEADCRTSSDPEAADIAFGHWNSENYPSGNGNTVIICPDMLFDFLHGNPKQLIDNFAHEIAHSVDPCSLGSLQTAVTSPSDTQHCSSKPAPSQDVSDFIARVNGNGGYVSCIHTPVQAPDGVTPVPPAASGHPETVKRFIVAMIHDHCYSGAHAACALSQYASPPQGPLAYCPIDFTGLDSIVTNERCPSARPILDELLDPNSPQGTPDQAREAFADFVASQSLVSAMNQSGGGFPAGPKLSEMSGAEKKSEILTTLATDCLLDADPGSDHPDWPYRISTYGSSSEIRAALGCAPDSVSANSVGFPSAACASKLLPPSDPDAQ